MTSGPIAFSPFGIRARASFAPRVTVLRNRHSSPLFSLIVDFSIGLLRLTGSPERILLSACCPFFNHGEHNGIGRRETGSLIGSDKVEGTAVYGANETKIGSIERVMIDKKSGRVSYAVLSFGGFLGIGDDHYPLPWQSLKYDTGLGGYTPA